LRARHPELHLDVDTAAHGLARLGDGLDAAIVLAREVDPALYAYRLDRNRVFAITSKSLAEGPNALRRPEDLARATVFLHRDMPDTLEAFGQALGLGSIEPRAIDHFDSGHLMLEAAAQGLGVAFMLESHLLNANDDRLVRLFDVEVDSPYSYWFACRPRALDNRAVRLFRDWVVELFDGTEAGNSA
jgi:LysR family glycine cleavage system transcriptional activator